MLYTLGRIRRLFAEHPEAVAFWVLACAHLVPVWGWRWLPTQDGPSHVNNAQILKDCSSPVPGYSEFFELRGEPLPNLTSHYLLAFLLYFFPPLLAEKILVSFYILGFAGSLRYFLGAFGPRCRPLSWAGLLFIFNRCFWMGFYNYCLSVILVWIILGYCLQRRHTLSLQHAPVLLLLFTVLFFTHLVGFLIALAGALMSTLLTAKRRLLATLLVGVAGLPGVCLTLNYLEQTRFRRAPAAMQIVEHPLAKLRGQRVDKGILDEIAGMDRELFQHHAGRKWPFGLFFLLYAELVAGLALATRTDSPNATADGPGLLFPVLFGVLIFVGYLLVPDHLGFDHGGFLKARLALLLPPIILACLREPAGAGARLLVRLVTVVLVIVNLFLVTWTVRAGNKELEPYVAGIDTIGRGHRLFIAQSADSPASSLVNPLLHAADYYCLGNDNINLDNYEAHTPHFPVKYRTGVNRARGDWNGSANFDRVDIILCWRMSAPREQLGHAEWDEIFAEGPLRIYRRLGRPRPP